MNELVSIIIPTCNGGWITSRAIESCLRQDYADIEVIVVNDKGSELGLKFADPRVRVVNGELTSKQFLGYGSSGYSRNIGLRAAQGAYVAFLDDDDLFFPWKISRQLSLMKIHGARVSCTNAYIGVLPFYIPFLASDFTDYYSEKLGDALSSLGENEIPLFLKKHHLRKHNFVITSSVLMERGLLEGVGGFNNIANGGQIINGVVAFEDWDAWLRVVEYNDFLYVNIPMLYYKRGSLKKLKRKVVAWF